MSQTRTAVHVGSALAAAVVLLGLNLVPILTNAAERMPYSILSPSAFPDARLVAADENPDLVLFPDTSLTLIADASYREAQPWQGQVYALLTLELTQNAAACLAYYSPSGWAAAPLRSLPLLGSEQVTLSTRLPVSDAGLLRLLLFKDAPTAKQLDSLLLDPGFGGQPLPGLLAQKWFARTPASRLGWGRISDTPWEDRLRPVLSSPTDFINQPWPAASMWLGQDLRLRCKDCSVSFSGPVSLGSDSWGSIAEWELSQINDLSASFSLPELWSGNRARIVVFARQGSGYFLPASPDFQLKISGFTAPAFVREDLNSSPGVSATQPFVCDISPYINGGLNRLRLRLGPLSNGDWKISGIQIWTD